MIEFSTVLLYMRAEAVTLRYKYTNPKVPYHSTQSDKSIPSKFILTKCTRYSNCFDENNAKT